MFEEENQILNEFQTIKQKLKISQERIDELEKNALVKEYIILIKQLKTLKKDYVKLNEKLEEEKMLNCKHLFIKTSNNDCVDFEMRGSNPILCCIKCGLTNLYDESEINREWLNPLEQKMGRIFYKTEKNGILVSNKVVSDINFAKEKLDSLLQNFPGASDEEIVEYLKISLENSKNKEKVL